MRIKVEMHSSNRYWNNRDKKTIPFLDKWTLANLINLCNNKIKI